MPMITLATKDLLLLLRDPRAAIILLVMPLLLILVLGLSLGEGFFSKPDDRLRVSLVDQDTGLPMDSGPFPGRPWSEVLVDDLANTADIRVEIIPTLAEAERLVRSGQRAAVLVLGPEFSQRVHRASFLSHATPPPLNPFYRDGISFDEVDVTLLRDPTQGVAAAIIEQVAQVTLLRVVLPWMIGKAFDRVGDPEFMTMLGEQIPLFNLIPGTVKQQMGPAVKRSIAKLFDRFNLTAKTWAELTKEPPRPPGSGAITNYANASQTGFLDRGAQRYQILVPSYTVTFAFFLVLTVGWLFVGERQQGTLVRLRLAPLNRSSILLGKFLSCMLIALFQGVFLLVMGNLLFGMHWGSEPWLLIPVVASTAFAAMGMAMLVAAIARTDSQVAIYGTLLVLVLAGLSGAMMPRDLMPEEMRRISYLTPHAWALDAYSQLLVNPNPEVGMVWQACGVLCLFGLGFLGLAWWRIRLD